MRAHPARLAAVSVTVALLVACSDSSGPPPAATSLSFLAQPGNAVRDTAETGSVQVAVLDQGGAVLTSATTSISLALGANPGGATLTGITTVAAVSGVATFPALKLDAVGTGYTLVASAAGLTGATSAPFNVTLSLADVDGDGFSPNTGDCNDTDGSVHPGATDLPDAAFLDNNCDGIDGDIAQAVFVAPGGSDGASCGAEAAPCLTVGTGVARAAAAGKRDVYIAAGTYNEAVTLADGVSLYGGYGATWARNPGNVSSITGTNGVAVAGGTAALTIYAHDLTKATVVADLRLVGPDATGQDAAGRGRSTYVVLVRNTASNLLTIARNTIVAGTASDGAAGAAGTDASILGAAAGMNGATGGSSVQQAVVCDATTRGAQGVMGTNAAAYGSGAMNGGAGGAGGTMDTDCTFTLGGFADVTASAGAQGSNAAYSAGVLGVGGAGGTGAASCGAVQAGNGGAVRNGGAGPAGSGGQLDGNGYWVANDGSDGSAGFHGGGGGGGGGSGGCDIGTDSYGAGGGGGGAGGAAARSGGGGGKGGGGSFAVYLVAASPAITNDDIQLGAAGSGGAGGTGGQGQSGGQGGAGGALSGAGGGPSGGSPAGGRGGDGAHGGHGGGGGGGGGGRSVGILLTSTASTPSISGTTFTGGAAGAGGPGGLSAPNAPLAERDGMPGNAGVAGTLDNQRTCGSPTSC